MATINQNLLAALEFGSAAMLGWLTAAVLPWFIHRWHRQRVQETSWAAVELLLVAMRQRASRVRIQQWLLLAMRTAILLLVAFAAAEPALRGWAHNPRGTARTHHVLVLDQSYSMRCGEKGATRFHRAQAAARKIVDSAQSGDAFTILGWSTHAENVLGRHTFDRALAREVIDQLEVLDTSAALPVAMRAAELAVDRAMREAPEVVHQRVVFFSDMGSNTWATGAAPLGLAEKTEILVEDVGDALRENLAVAELTVEPARVLRQQGVFVLARVRGFGFWERGRVPTTAGKLRRTGSLELSIDGVRVGREAFELTAGGEAEVRFDYRFVDEGRHALQVAISGDGDGLPADDRRLLLVDVLPEVRVACVAGRRGAADDFARALAPAAGGTTHAEVVSASRLGELSLPNYAAVVLCNVGEVSRYEVAAIERYVRAGGALVLLLGDEVEGGQYQKAFAASGMLPVEMGSVSQEGSYRLDPLEYRHQIVAPFRDREKAGLLSVMVSRYFRLKPLAGRPQLQAVLAFDSGDPALVVDHFGQGTVAVLALPGSLASPSAGGSPWSSFALSPSFLPIVRELISFVTNDRALEAHNLVVGQPILHVRDESASGENYWIRSPAGEQQELPAVTTASGLYTVGTAEQELARYAVNLDTRESDLRVARAEELPAGVTLVGGKNDRASSSRKGYQAGVDVSLVPLLLAAALVLLLAELLVAWLMGRGWG